MLMELVTNYALFTQGSQQRRRLNKLASADSSVRKDLQATSNETIEAKFEKDLAADPNNITILSNYARHLFTASKSAPIQS